MSHLRGKTGEALKKAQADNCTEDTCYKPQSPEDDRGPGYANDVPNDWRRGNGMKPGFDSKHGK